MGSPLEKITVTASSDVYADILRLCLVDIRSVTRAKQTEIIIEKQDTPVVVKEIT
jgi:hypothetical protein